MRSVIVCSWPGKMWIPWAIDPTTLSSLGRVSLPAAERAVHAECAVAQPIEEAF